MTVLEIVQDYILYTRNAIGKLELVSLRLHKCSRIKTIQRRFSQIVQYRIERLMASVQCYDLKMPQLFISC